MVIKFSCDDFKLSGPQSGVHECWKLLKEGLEFSNTGPIDKFLGVNHTIGDDIVEGHKVRRLVYDIRDFTKQCCDSYKALARLPDDKPLRRAETPFVTVTDARPTALCDHLPDPQVAKRKANKKPQLPIASVKAVSNPIEVLQASLEKLKAETGGL